MYKRQPKTRVTQHAMFVNEAVWGHPESAQYIFWNHQHYCDVCDKRLANEDNYMDRCLEHEVKDDSPNN
jgi:hypothetical protein